MPVATYAAELRQLTDAWVNLGWDGMGLSESHSPVLGSEGLRVVGMNHAMRGHRALTAGVLGTIAFVAVGAWGVVNLLEGDWFIGGLFVACMLLGLPSLASTVRRMHREESRPSVPARRQPG